MNDKHQIIKKNVATLCESATILLGDNTNIQITHTNNKCRIYLQNKKFEIKHFIYLKHKDFRLRNIKYNNYKLHNIWESQKGKINVKSFLSYLNDLQNIFIGYNIINCFKDYDKNSDINSKFSKHFLYELINNELKSNFYTINPLSNNKDVLDN